MEDTRLLSCLKCNFKFTLRGNLNRHNRKMHGTKTATMKERYIKCILCCLDKVIRMFSSYKDYNKHLEETHKTIVKASTWTFASTEEFNLWLDQNNRAVNYIIRRTSKTRTNIIAYYECNRSDSYGIHSKNMDVMKLGGSIKMHGSCPSRMVVRNHENGQVEVQYFETHLGHIEEVRAQQLSKKDQIYVVEQLKAGISKETIIANARSYNLPESGLPGRLNTINRKDLSNLNIRYNVENIDQSDLIAIAMKVEEWNANGKKFAFLFKQIGDSTHPVLGTNDFALAYMNTTMEKKLRDFSKVVCIDGTHGLTKYRHWELTIMIVKDDTQDGFPVAFMLSNRKDQLMQECFLDALKEKYGSSILVDYFMSDDDPRFYNAWMKVMGNSPRKLLSSWHVVETWNIQGKKNIYNSELRKSVQTDLQRVMKATTEVEFVRISKEYFKKIARETMFTKYLRRRYFNNDDRIQSWAHCYRDNVGINTNLALESLNRYIKTEKLHGNGLIRIEALFNALEEIVEEKMHKRILVIHRLDRNTCQTSMVNVNSDVEPQRNAEDIGELVHIVNASSRNQKHELPTKVMEKHELPTKVMEKHELPTKVMEKHELPTKVMEKHELPTKVMEKHELPTKVMEKHELPTKVMEKHEHPTKVMEKHELPTKVMQKHELPTKVMEKHELPTKVMEKKRKHQEIMDNCRKFVDEMDVLMEDDEPLFNFFQGLFNTLEIKMRQRFGQTTMKRKQENKNYFPNKKRKFVEGTTKEAVRNLPEI